MRTAADDRNRFRQIRFFRKDPLLPLSFVTFETTLSFYPIVTHSGYRNIDDAKNGLSRLYQGNIHGEFSIFIDELFCTVERIHQPKFTPLFSYLISRNTSFFRNDRNIRRYRSEER